MSATVDTRELVALERRFGTVPNAIVRGAVPGMRRVVLTAERNAKRDVRVDRGDLRRSITSVVEVHGTTVVGRWGSNKPHARPNEFGRAAGGRMPPQGVLVASGWLRRHGIPESAEFVVRRAIARRGIKAQPFIRRPAAELRTLLVRELGHLGQFVKTELVGR